MILTGDEQALRKQQQSSKERYGKEKERRKTMGKCAVFAENNRRKERRVRATHKWCSASMLRHYQEYKISSKVYEHSGWKHVRWMCVLSCSNEIYFRYLPIWSFFSLSLFLFDSALFFFFAFFSPSAPICKKSRHEKNRLKKGNEKKDI